MLDDGKSKLALVVCDLLGLHYSVSKAARERIEKATGIPASHVLISGTHTHSASSALGQKTYEQDPSLDDYQEFVVMRIADAVQRAANTLRPAELAFVQVDIPEHLNNRRWFMRPGSMPENPFGDANDRVKMNPPAGSPNLVEPAGPIDPQVSFFAVREPAGKPISVFAAYSLHYVGGPENNAISADYFGVFCGELARLLGADRLDPPLVAMLANGTSGDINNINFRNPRPRKPAFEQTRYVANDVAAKIYDAMLSASYGREVTLDARYREVPVIWRHPTAEQVAWANKTLADPDKSPKRVTSRVYAERFLRLAEYPESGTIPLQTLRIGSTCIGTMPCEVFAEIGLDFKQRSPLKPAFMVELNHGYYGYLPTPRQFDLGGYETWLGTNRVERTTSDKLMAQLLEMADELKAALPKSEESPASK